MLELKDITKDYPVGGDVVHALKGVSLTLRSSEFVSILGPSGCGKTTLLNIIGGLDHYTSGDLVIDGISTKKYKDRDWDTYRNHSIGFVFQSYNLIPHQTVLENVELALNISGVSKEERIARAKLALDKVGLAGMYKKKPNQLSGGQCQRVAIARALVSDPEILLADEPTGALDTETSVQIMELVKEISKDRLVIMVTHNPDLAEKYSTRIVRLLDGLVTDDTDPYIPVPEAADADSKIPDWVRDAITDGEANADGESEQAEPEPVPAEPAEQTPAEQPLADSTAEAAQTDIAAERKAKENKYGKKSKLGVWSAFKLSARNLLSKLKRTILVCFAGSIGIIGVASVLAVSTGVRAYIDDMQEKMLTGNPITVQPTAMNFEGLSALQNTQNVADSFKIEDGKVNINFMIEFLAERSDNLKDMVVQNEITQEYVDFVKAMPTDYYNELGFSYGINMGNSIYTDYMFTGTEGERLSLTAAQTKYTAILGKVEKLKDYASLTSMIAINYSQMPSSVDFITSQYDIVHGDKIATEANEIMIVLGDKNDVSDLFLAQLGFLTQDEFLNIAYKAAAEEGEDTSSYTYPDTLDMKKLLNKEFTWYPNDTVFSENDNSDPTKPSSINPFFYNPVADDSWPVADDWATNDEFDGGIKLKVTALLRPKPGLMYGTMESGIYYTPALTQRVLVNSARSRIVDYLKTQTTSGAIRSGKFPMPGTSMTINTGIIYDYSFTYDDTEYSDIEFIGSTIQGLDMVGSMIGGGNEQISNILDSLSSSYTLALKDVGGSTLPTRISIYPISFDQKYLVTQYLDRWNADPDSAFTFTDADGNDVTVDAVEHKSITYSDILEIIITLVDGLIDAVTISLVAFTSLSLVVSTVMIAIITYVSVIERIKEIGVIRSLGGRKRDVSNLFIAETVIIGGISGVIGLVVTFFITLIINAIVNSIAAVGTIATLTWAIIGIMMAISVGLTLISGLVPARLAAKKDPVEALRTE